MCAFQTKIELRAYGGREFISGGVEVLPSVRRVGGGALSGRAVTDPLPFPCAVWSFSVCTKCQNQHESTPKFRQGSDPTAQPALRITTQAQANRCRKKRLGSSTFSQETSSYSYYCLEGLGAGYAPMEMRASRSRRRS